MTIKNHFQGKRNQKSGEIGESLVRRELEKQGYKMVEKVATPWRVIWRNGRPSHAFPVEKVSGDFIAVEPMTGRKVLVEVKSRDDGGFPWSMLDDHQVRALQENHILGAVSLLGLVFGMRARIVSWPVAGFGPGKSIKFEGGNNEI